MRAWSGMQVGTVAVTVFALAGCGQATDGPPAAAAASTSAQAVAAPIFRGPCGDATESEIANIAGLGEVRLVTANALLCRWEPATTGSSVTFKWIRRSPIDDYRTVQPDQGVRRSPIDIAGQSGFSWQSEHSCEVAARAGDTDFIAWTITSSTRSASDDCTAAGQLAATTLTKR